MRLQRLVCCRRSGHSICGAPVLASAATTAAGPRRWRIRTTGGVAAVPTARIRGIFRPVAASCLQLEPLALPARNKNAVSPLAVTNPIYRANGYKKHAWEELWDHHHG